MTKEEKARREEANAKLSAALNDPSHFDHVAARQCAKVLATDFRTPARSIMNAYGFGY